MNSKFHMWCKGCCFSLFIPLINSSQLPLRLWAKPQFLKLEIGYRLRGNVCIWAKWLIISIISGLCSMRRLIDFLLPLDGMLVHRMATPTIKLTGTPFVHLGGESKVIPQEHSTISPARTQTRTDWPRVKRTNHEASATPNGKGTKDITAARPARPGRWRRV